MARLTGKITDVTSKAPENISSITVKAPAARVGGGTDVIVSSPATVDFDRVTGDVTISNLTGGLSWLYMEGEGWSDSIAIAVAEGMISLVEAIANAAGTPGFTDYARLLAKLELAVGDVAQDAVDAAAAAIRWTRGQVSSDTDLNSFVTEGTHYAGSSVSATLLNRPSGGEHPADVIIKRAGPYVYQYWTTYRGGDIESETFYRWSLNEGTDWTAWRKKVTQADLRRQNPARPAVLKQRSRIRRGGVIGTNGATPVALTFDHGFGNFRDLVLPILRRLGLPATVAFNDGQMDNAENGGATWTDLQTWGINHGIEYAHHAQSHNDVAVDNLESALTSSIAAAATNLPALATDAFIMPGVSGTKWQGFNGGNTDSSWWEHPAGQIIATHFPVVSGTTAGYYVPMMGGEDNTWTMHRYSFDNDTRANYFRTKIRQLAGTGMGIAGFMHPSVIDNGSGGTSLTKLTEILEFLAAERDAGSIEVLTLSGFAYADTSTSRRLELGTTWDSNNNCVIDVGENMAWLKGAQVLISTTPTLGGGTRIAVTDDTGRSSSITYAATAGVPIYRAITIPTDATQVTVTCRGNSRSIRVV